jgi:hypothetical protein
MLVKAAITLCGLALGAGSAVAVNTDSTVDARLDRAGSDVVTDADVNAAASVWATASKPNSSALAGFMVGDSTDGHTETGNAFDGAGESTESGADSTGATEGSFAGASGATESSFAGASGTTGEGSGENSGSTGTGGNDSVGTDGNDSGDGSDEHDDAYYAKCASLALAAGLTADLDGSAGAGSGDGSADAEVTAGAALWLWLELGC